MSDNSSLTRKTISAHSAVVGGASLGYLVSLVMAMLSGAFGLFDFFALISFVLGLVSLRGAYKGYADIEYGKANQNALVASIASIAAAIMGFI